MLAVLLRIPSTEINLYEIESQLLEKQPAVAALMAVEPHIQGYGVIVPETAARASARIAVNSGFEPERMYAVNNRFKACGKTNRMKLEFSGSEITTSEISVIDIDITVADRIQTESDQRLGLTQYQRVADVYPVSVPRTPAHDGSPLRRHGNYTHYNNKKQNYLW